MKLGTLIAIAVVGGGAWFAFEASRPTGGLRVLLGPPSPAAAATVPAAAPVLKRVTTPSFSCDDRTYCSQMRSCDEATFFLRNCPGTQMDGDGDGIPCESQWCH